MPGDKPPQKPALEQQTQIKPRVRKKGLLNRSVSAGWFVASIVIILMQFAYSYKPRLAIEAGVALDEHDPLATLFRIVNIGPWHLNDIRFSCLVSTSSVRDLTLDSNVMLDGSGNVATGQGPIAQLDRGRSATRDCGVGMSSHFVHIPPYDPTSLRLDITVRFRWPFVAVPDQETRHFTARKLADGRAILVPDVER